MSYTEMEESDRETIQRNYATLVRECNIEKLLPVLEQKEVFPTQAIEKYKTLKDNLKIKRAVFFEIQSRGPKAFAKLVTSLHETDQSALAERLDPTFVTYLQPKKHARPFQLPTNVAESTCNPEDIIALAQNNAHNTINLNAEPLKVKVTFSHSFYDQHTHVPTYSTHSKKRGIVLIINMIKYMNDVHLERKGAEVDGRNLIDLFSQMGFIVEYHINLSANRIKDVIFEFKSSPQLEGCDMAFVIIMGHGEDINHKKNTHVSDNLSEVIGYDNQSVSNKWIEEQFTNGECKKLQNKPKIFMYQMCRGKFPDFGAAQSRIEHDSGIRTPRPARVMLRSCSDMLIAHSTLPGDASHRDVYLGTWYINLFCKYMMLRAHDTHLEDIFKLIDSELAHLRSAEYTMQTSMYTNIGFKTCYVHPGIYLDGNEIRRIDEDAVPEVNDNVA